MDFFLCALGQRIMATLQRNAIQEGSPNCSLHWEQSEQRQAEPDPSGTRIANDDQGRLCLSFMVAVMSIT